MRPIIKFTSDNATLGAALLDRFISATITDQKGITSDTLELQLDDHDNKLAAPPTGVKLTVLVGYAEKSLVNLGTFIVDETGFSGGAGQVDTLVVRARASNMRQTIKAQKTRNFDDISVGNLIKTIAGEHGLIARVSAKYASRVFPHIAQTSESDLNLITRLAKTMGAVAKPAGEYLLFVEQGKGKSATGKKLASVTINKSQCSTWDFTTPERDKYQAVSARWHDLSTGDNETLQAGSGEPVMELPTVYSDEAAAREAADAKYETLKRATEQFNFTCVGDPNLQAEAPLNAVGFRPGVAGSWTISQVTHAISSSGYTCSVQAVKGDVGGESV